MKAFFLSDHFTSIKKINLFILAKLMGVRQLQSFIQNTVPDGYKRISLYEECETFQRTNNERPILVIDVMGLLRPLIKNQKELLCGLRHNEIYKIVEDLFKKMSSIADLVFFEDGPVNDVKLPEWIKRQMEQYETSIRIISKINEGVPLDEIIGSERNFPSQTSHLIIVGSLAKQYGTVVISVTKECDTEIAQYACRNSRVLAILADDSDFLIYPGNWRYFSLRELDQNSLMTMEYNRTALRTFLNLNDFELVLLSTLNGNDVISYEDATPFHRYLLRQYRNPHLRFPAISEFIHYERLTHSSDIYGDIAYILFGNKSNMSNKKVKESIDFYNINFQVPVIQNELLRYCHENSLNFVYSVINYMMKTFTIHYIDLREFKNHSARVQHLFQKQIGILLKQNLAKPYSICSKISHNDIFRKSDVNPIYPNFSMPCLMELLNREQYPHHDFIRVKLLKWLVNEEKLQNADILSIPVDYLLDILTLTYMVGGEFIESTEADIILLSIKHVVTDTMPENIVVPDIVHPRAFMISFLFSKCHMFIERCLEATGLKKLKKIHNFDGVLYHNLHFKYLNNPFNLTFLLGDLKEHRYYA